MALRYLVVGGDGKIGRSLTTKLQDRGGQVLFTSRRPGSAEGLFLDLSGEINFSLLPNKPEVVFLCAAISNIGYCEAHKDYSSQVNVNAQLNLGKHFVDQGSFVVFLSSNTVFSCEEDNNTEHQKYSYTTEYGRQKAAAESGLLGLQSRNLAVVRLSKVVDHQDFVFGRFLNDLREGVSFEAFEDLMVSPISLSYALKSLLMIADAKKAGVFHLGSDSEVSYAGFARLMAVSMGLSVELIKGASVASAPFPVYFQPKHPLLTMTEVTSNLGLKPEPLMNVIHHLVEGERSAG